MAAKIKVLIPRIYAITRSKSERDGTEHAAIIEKVRDKTHAAGDLLREALGLLDPDAGRDMIPGSGLLATPARLAVIASLRAGDAPMSALELTIELERWSNSTIRRVTRDLEQAGLLTRARRLCPGKAPVSVWSLT